MRKEIYIIVGMLLLLSLLSLAVADDISKESDVTVLHFFYGKGCPHCSKGLDFLEKDYSNLVIEKHEIYFNDSERLFFIIFY